MKLATQLFFTSLMVNQYTFKNTKAPLFSQNSLHRDLQDSELKATEGSRSNNSIQISKKLLL
jgi:hypothetical protein